MQDLAIYIRAVDEPTRIFGWSDMSKLVSLSNLELGEIITATTDLNVVGHNFIQKGDHLIVSDLCNGLGLMVFTHMNGNKICFYPDWANDCLYKFFERFE